MSMKYERRAFLLDKESRQGLDRAEAVELARLSADIGAKVKWYKGAGLAVRSAIPAWSLPLAPLSVERPHLAFVPLSWQPPRTPIILIADEPRRGPMHLDPFAPRMNRIAWDGPRLSDGQQCGGGRRVIRKAETDS